MMTIMDNSHRHPRDGYVLAATTVLILVLVVLALAAEARDRRNRPDDQVGSAQQTAQSQDVGQQDAATTEPARQDAQPQTEIDCADETVSMEDWQQNCADPGTAATVDEFESNSATEADTGVEEEKVRVPNLIGWSRSDIRRHSWPREYGIQVHVSTERGYLYSASCQVQRLDQIVNQHPEPGQMVRRGSMVVAKSTC